MKMFFLKFGQGMLQAYKFGVLKIYLMGICFFLIFISCQQAFEFQPENSDDLHKLSAEGIEIKFESFFVRGSPEGLQIWLKMTNHSPSQEVIIKNDMKIVGQYFVSNILHALSWDDLSTREREALFLKEGPFKIIGQDIEISLTCLLEKRTNKDFYDVIKEEKFRVKFPTFIVGGKEYEFEPINFVYKKAKR